MGPHGEHVRAREPEARVLPLDGVPHRPVAGQQHRQPPARLRGAAGRRGQGSRLARPARGGAGRRPGERRARAPGRVLPRVHGDETAPGHGLRAALRVRHLPPGHPGWLAARGAGQLAAPPGSVGGRPPPRDGGGRARLRVRAAGGDAARGHRSAVDPDRHPLRPARGRPRRPDDQHAPAVGGGGRPTPSISRRSAAGSSSARSPRRSPPNR